MSKYTIVLIDRNAPAYNFVRPSFDQNEWHIAGTGRKPTATAACGVKRAGAWADTKVSTPAIICPACLEAQAN